MSRRTDGGGETEAETPESVDRLENANLLESMQIATLFLDRNLALKIFTSAAKDLFHLIESDVGRPITHIRTHLDADTVGKDAERVLRTLSSIERKVESRDNGARYVMRLIPYRTLDDVIAGVVITFVDITKITAAEARINDLAIDLRNRVQSIESLVDLVPVGVMVVEDNAVANIKVNRAAARLMGETAVDGPGPRQTERARLFCGGRELSEAEHPLYRASHAGEVVPLIECRLLRTDGSTVDVMMSATPLRDTRGAVRGGIAALVDISEQKRAEAHQQVLLHDLQHRVKNILATISALATRMLRDAPSVDGFSNAFLGRLRAMAVTHELLSQANWTGAGLRQLLETTLRGQNPSAGAIHIDGPAVLLTPAAASTLGMVVYEMATNAAKYGALASARGHIEIGWTVIRDPAGNRLRLCWTERAEPPVPATIVDGFGVAFIKGGVEYELQGSAVVEPRPAGLRWELEFPLKANVKDI